MKTMTIARALFPCLLLASAAFGSGGGMTPDAQVRKLQSDFATAWKSHDAKAVAGYWSPDGDVITPDGKTWTGREQVEGFFDGAFKTMLKDTTFTPMVANIRWLTPSIAIVDCSYTVENERDAAGNPITERGLYTSVVMRKGGRWWLAAVRPMVPLPMDGAGATH
jgi:uncharacterized protein (TIGR02246 family)